MPEIKYAVTPALKIAYSEFGSAQGWPVVLTHGFPYDVHAFDEVAAILVNNGARVILPYIRGFGPTSFISAEIIRSGQQAARGSDLIRLIEVLGLTKPIIGGYDWGGNASCVAAALWPDHIGGLVSYAGYDIIDIVEQQHAFPASLERICWYQHLFQTERGRECLNQDRHALCRILWQEWSPEWAFDEDIFERSAASFDNPDFVDVVLHSYRHMHGSEKGDPQFESLEIILAGKPPISIPSITLDGHSDPLKPGGTADHAKYFSGQYEHRSFACGHNFPQEEPTGFAEAVLTVRDWIS
ncbi:pimeloyl-ACP methyl ester carboxylesterase [Mucilaginibacter sp. SG538B]|uniref:alpha/beta hydrolase n=1 Tax=Mucilaginibacter sp. SG538B TaxID=2587021 RepID=UPI00159D0AB9|nr:alpha/beta hydrolase [Mucilaginibacter sp. SG538B]NVM66552.1 pimeloyl-ACP methyl ester carboxylesterase [Mucilaginibacter sp. SG538B]